MHPDTPPAWTIHCDGSAVPNPGRMGLGAVITAPDGSRQDLSASDGERGCNNEAELRALMMALRTLEPADVPALRIYSDNSVLVAQLADEHAMKGTPPIARLAVLFDEARVLLARFDHTALHWIPRHRNGQADALARAAVGLPSKPAASPASPRVKRKSRRKPAGGSA